MGVKRVPPKKKKKKTKESKLIEKLRKRFGDKEVESLLNSMQKVIRAICLRVGVKYNLKEDGIVLL